MLPVWRIPHVSNLIFLSFSKNYFPSVRLVVVDFGFIDEISAEGKLTDNLPDEVRRQVGGDSSSHYDGLIARKAYAVTFQ